MTSSPSSLSYDHLRCGLVEFHPQIAVQQRHRTPVRGCHLTLFVLAAERPGTIAHCHPVCIANTTARLTHVHIHPCKASLAQVKPSTSQAIFWWPTERVMQSTHYSLNSPNCSHLGTRTPLSDHPKVHHLCAKPDDKTSREGHVLNAYACMPS